MGRCCYMGCQHRSGEATKASGVTFHCFPRDPTLREAWVEAIGRTGWTPSKHSVVCSKHFQNRDMDRTSLARIRLRPGAVPIAHPSVSAPELQVAQLSTAPEAAHEAEHEMELVTAPGGAQEQLPAPARTQEELALEETCEGEHEQDLLSSSCAEMSDESTGFDCDSLHNPFTELEDEDVLGYVRAGHASPQASCSSLNTSLETSAITYAPYAAATSSRRISLDTASTSTPVTPTRGIILVRTIRRATVSSQTTEGMCGMLTSTVT
ncbi:THAP domain-containing protein 3-like [Ornithodoros turicata]|uniref:THAP domain-containing protein 3-like n=1 Tax=Ornithodoros turicata TaxID=34597 RepID=UPI003138B6C8